MTAKQKTPRKRLVSKDAVIHLRLPREQKDRFATTADAAGMTLSTWLRIACEEKAKRGQ